jgi:hypothetical protein
MSRQTTVYLCVPCTKRKRISSSTNLVMRNLPPSSVDVLARNWVDSLRQSPSVCSARELYAGKGWMNAVVAHREACIQWPSELMVLSAGYGLISADYMVNGYSATFANDEDQISRRMLNQSGKSEYHREWWAHLNHLQGRTDTPCANFGRGLDDAIFIFAMGSDYVHALQDDLVQLVTCVGTDRFFLINVGHKGEKFPELLRNSILPIDIRIEKLVAGTRSYINTGALVWLLKYVVSKVGWNRNEMVALISQLLDEIPIARTRVGLKRSSDWVLSWISENVSDSDCLPSATELLSKFRQLGNGFEERKFRLLYTEVLGSLRQ